ncbi:bis(5'-nucleosyl)-tetraphosphatase (symmetrical) YqeK [Paenibacillus sp. GXUN7292]|uniref:bis(5'-nucleosyl)-tetraphosphatase (symmetrical) YqeK n=1 Tax=Paenibacillus sp. GXUN7292 TaxID=3422499 RepID=UPI003D7C44FC
MDRLQLINTVKQEMPQRRWLHTEGVMQTAIELARRFGGDPEKAELAAIVHDTAKYWAVDRMERMIRENNLDIQVLQYEKELWHAPVGAWVAEHVYGITDSEVLNAVRYHTSGRAGMSLLEKIVWVADYIEPGRSFPGVEQVRAISETDLDGALLSGLMRTIDFLKEKGKQIYPLTLEARDSLQQEILER